MLYFGLGYAGLYFPPIAPALPPSEASHLEYEVRMSVVTRALAPAAAILHTATIVMEVAPFVLIPMTRGVADRVDLPMHVPTRAWLEKT